ncbi:glycine cleavage system aminomethyltransferase GcvT [Muribaculaceae bacterium Isolate-104 (HZI)]|jgi:aminomethyltransferase|nr:glycine cleavage system aminomethyltransferase GcvT [Muribaculaceae bacterium Isolate-104 (HZI)]
METIKKTCLHPRHVALGAQMAPFAGFDMPIQYSGITEEHNAVRNSCGVFDVSHMGEVLVSGSDAEKFVNHIFTNDIAGAPDGKIFYGMMLHPHGGTVDDLLVYRRGENNFLLVINAANIDKDIRWMHECAEGFNVKIDDLCDELAELAVQGPLAEDVMENVLGIHCADLAFYTFKETALPDGSALLVSRTGYTGEDGFEIYARPDIIVEIWDTLMASGKVTPCGLGCRDTLRFEVGLPLYGDELADDITPLEAGLPLFVKLDKPGGFIGRDALAAMKAQGLRRRLVGIELADRAIPRHGYEVLTPDGTTVIGTVTTGYRGISVDKSIAMALVSTEYADAGTQVAVRIRKKTFPATVTSRKFYKKSYKK